MKSLADEYGEIMGTEDANLLSSLARQELDKSKIGDEEFAIKAALLEAVAANPNTPKPDRIHLASSSSFPNILIRLGKDPDPEVREAVAANPASKNWLLSRLAQDCAESVQEAALKNPNSSWKARLDAAQSPRSSAPLLEFLSSLGAKSEAGTEEGVLSSMVRSSVARNPNCPKAVLERLKRDTSGEVREGAEGACPAGNVQ